MNCIIYEVRCCHLLVWVNNGSLQHIPTDGATAAKIGTAVWTIKFLISQVAQICVFSDKVMKFCDWLSPNWNCMNTRKRKSSDLTHFQSTQNGTGVAWPCQSQWSVWTRTFPFLSPTFSALDWTMQPLLIIDQPFHRTACGRSLFSGHSGV